MRGKDEQQLDVFSYVNSEQRVPQDHPLRPLRIMTDEALRRRAGARGFGEHGHIPDGVIHVQANEPTEQQVIVELLHRQPLASHRVQRLQQEARNNFSGANRRSSGFGVQLVQPWLQISPKRLPRVSWSKPALPSRTALTDVTGPELRLASHLKLWIQLRLCQRAFLLHRHVHCHPYLQCMFKLRGSCQPPSY